MGPCKVYADLNDKLRGNLKYEIVYEELLGIQLWQRLLLRKHMNLKLCRFQEIANHEILD